MLTPIPQLLLAKERVKARRVVLAKPRAMLVSYIYCLFVPDD